MRDRKVIAELGLAVALGAMYPLAYGPLTFLAGSVYLPAVHAMYKRGWVSTEMLLPTVRVVGDVVTMLFIAVPFGLTLGLIARRSTPSAAVALFLAAIVATVVTVAAQFLGDTPPAGLIESLQGGVFLVIHERDHWLFPLAASTTAVCVYRWRLPRNPSPERGL